ncbi:acyl-CoA dehydrogenase family protein [Nocardia sp. NPDC047038]|uniref:acyl-CoA dehydrogenase family protein n=1 Tax=Nocardia sp. NPDC047038 TaxID=3154338 RepID=UPI0033D42B8A
MIRHTPALTAEQADIANLIGVVVARTTEHVGDEYPDEVAQIRRRLAELGVWTIGVAEDAADSVADEFAAVAFSALGRNWPALGWATVQAHAAVESLGRHPLAESVRSGAAAVAVVDERSTAVRLTVTDGRVHGRIDRIDPAGTFPHIVVLGRGHVRVIPPEALTFHPLARTGLDGACTASAEISAPVPESTATIIGVDTEAARIRLMLGAAAVALGTAQAAAEAALSYAAQREQFGSPLIRLANVRDALFSSSAAVATGLREVLRARDCSVWQATAVVDAVCEQAIDTCALAVQAHGGYGYLTEYQVERMLRDVVSLRAACDVSAARRVAAGELVGVDTKSEESS